MVHSHAIGSTIHNMDRKLLLLAALVLLPPATRAAGDAPLDRATLRGLKGIGVIIDVLDPELEKLGITRDMVLSRLLARLQTDRIVIDPSANEFVGLRITAVRSGRGPYALSVTLALYQPVLLSRNHELRTSTQTWEVESVLMADAKAVGTACSETADELSDRFASAFHAVNP
jgi:hypothetical protein